MTDRPPLALAAVEARLRADYADEDGFGADAQAVGDVKALLAALRATRAALHEAQARLQLWQDRMDEMPLFFDENEVIERAAAVLASVTEGPA